MHCCGRGGSTSFVSQILEGSLSSGWFGQRRAQVESFWSRNWTSTSSFRACCRWCFAVWSQRLVSSTWLSMCSSKDFRFCEKPQSHVYYKSFHEVPRCALISLSRPWIYYVSCSVWEPAARRMLLVLIQQLPILVGQCGTGEWFWKRFQTWLHSWSLRQESRSGREVDHLVAMQCHVHPWAPARANPQGSSQSQRRRRSRQRCSRSSSRVERPLDRGNARRRLPWRHKIAFIQQRSWWGLETSLRGRSGASSVTWDGWSIPAQWRIWRKAKQRSLWAARWCCQGRVE